MSNPRYIKQRDSFRCVPHAIVNSLKWAGQKPDTQKMITKLCFALDTHAGYGTRPGGIYAVMRTVLKGVIKQHPRVYRPTLGWLRRKGEEGFGFFIVHKLPFDELIHMSFISKRVDDGFIVVNSFIDDIKKTKTELFVPDDMFVERVINKNKHPSRGDWFVIPLEKF